VVSRSANWSVALKFANEAEAGRFLDLVTTEAATLNQNVFLET
jgi:hypothetical protein